MGAAVDVHVGEERFTGENSARKQNLSMGAAVDVYVGEERYTGGVLISSIKSKS